MNGQDRLAAERLNRSGWAALQRGAWEDARAAFASALKWAETAEALEGLGWSSWWLNDVPATFDARERAYRLYRERGNDQPAGRMAIVLAADHVLRRGEHAVASGWFQRAHHLLDGLDPCPEQAMLGIWESYVVAVFARDTATARQLGERARGLANSLGALDLEMLAQASLGFATVCEGDVTEGMRLLDEAVAAAVAGEMSDPDAIVTTCCYLISACERVHDYDRAAQWCRRAMQLADRWSYRFMFAYCRSHYAGVLIWRGAWNEAEAELAAATGELATTFPAMAAEGIARLADLRHRQGRTEDALALLDRLDNLPLRAMGSKLALLGRATIALDRGDPASAADLAERYLRGMPASDRVERVEGLALLARAQVDLGHLKQAARSLAELQEVASAVATPAFRAIASAVAGALAAASANGDMARRHWEDAIDLFEATGAPYEAARCRLELASALIRAERAERARAEIETALNALRRLGASREVERAHVLLGDLERPSQSLPQVQPARPLTAREIEVLRLVASGQSDKEIGATLGVSAHTAHRHVANILTKLAVPSRAAAVARAAQHHLI